VLPADAARSEWDCSLERVDGALCVRLGLRYVRGLREQAGRAIVRERERAPFLSIDGLALRVPDLRKEEMNMLAEVGALNPLKGAHRREALWQAGRAARLVGPLLEDLPEPDAVSPLAMMTAEERLSAHRAAAGGGRDSGCAGAEFPVRAPKTKGPWTLRPAQ
jgi:error-prone DNA polymerase